MHADTTHMSQISPRMRIVAFAGLGLVVLLVAVKFLVLSGHNEPKPLVIVHHKTTVHHRSAPAKKTPAKAVHHAKKPKKQAAPKLHLDPSLPAPLRRALSHSKIVVAVLYAPDVPGDDEAVNEARKGARAAHVGFTMLNVRNEAIARAVARQVDNASDPSVLVIRRPGTVALKFDGFIDAEAVAQAAANTRP